MTYRFDPNLSRKLSAFEYDNSLALADPGIPVLPRLKDSMIQLMEYLATELSTKPGPGEMERREPWGDDLSRALVDLNDLLVTLLTGGEVQSHHFGMFPSEDDDVRWVCRVIREGIFEDPDAWTKSPSDLAFCIQLQVMRRAMELKTGRTAVVTEFDERGTYASNRERK